MFGIKGNYLFITFDITGAIVHFDTREPTVW